MISTILLFAALGFLLILLLMFVVCMWPPGGFNSKVWLPAIALDALLFLATISAHYLGW